MIRLQWNALRVGDHVLVHDETSSDMTLMAGQVTMIQTLVGSNDITVRVDPTDGASDVRCPRRLAVHLDTLDPHENCWRCSVDANTARRLQRTA